MEVVVLVVVVVLVLVLVLLLTACSSLGLSGVPGECCMCTWLLQPHATHSLKVFEPAPADAYTLLLTLLLFASKHIHSGLLAMQHKEASQSFKLSGTAR
jgi:hypothetical protein